MRFWIESAGQNGPIQTGGFRRVIDGAATLLRHHSAMRPLRFPAISRCLKQLRRALSDLRAADLYNQCLQKKRALLASPTKRAAVLNLLGGEARLTAWERADAVAKARKLCPLAEREADRQTLTLRLEGRRKAQYWKRQCALYGTDPNAAEPYKYTEFRLPPLTRRTRRTRLISQEGGIASHQSGAPAHDIYALPPIVVTPSDLRPPKPRPRRGAPQFARPANRPQTCGQYRPPLKAKSRAGP